MDEFEKWYSEKYPLPSTIERGPIGRGAKEQARAAWAEKSAENKLLWSALKKHQRCFGEYEQSNDICKRCVIRKECEQVLKGHTIQG